MPRIRQNSKKIGKAKNIGAAYKQNVAAPFFPDPNRVENGLQGARQAEGAAEIAAAGADNVPEDDIQGQNELFAQNKST